MLIRVWKNRYWVSNSNAPHPWIDNTLRKWKINNLILTQAIGTAGFRTIIASNGFNLEPRSHRLQNNGQSFSYAPSLNPVQCPLKQFLSTHSIKVSFSVYSDRYFQIKTKNAHNEKYYLQPLKFTPSNKKPGWTGPNVLGLSLLLQRNKGPVVNSINASLPRHTWKGSAIQKSIKPRKNPSESVDLLLLETHIQETIHLSGWLQLPSALRKTKMALMSITHG